MNAITAKRNTSIHMYISGESTICGGCDCNNITYVTMIISDICSFSYCCLK